MDRVQESLKGFFKGEAETLRTLSLTLQYSAQTISRKAAIAQKSTVRVHQAEEEWMADISNFAQHVATCQLTALPRFGAVGDFISLAAPVLAAPVLAAPEAVGLLEAATFVITRRSKATSKFERLKLRLVYSDLQKNPTKRFKRAWPVGYYFALPFRTFCFCDSLKIMISMSRWNP